MMRRFNDWIERNERAAITVVLLLLCLMVVVLLSGCFSEPRGPVQPCESAQVDGLKDQLGSVGEWFVCIGLLACGLGLVARFAAILFVPSIARFVDLFGDIAELGFLAAIVGGLFVWLSTHFWVLVLACVLTALAWAWWRRAAIRRWLDRIKAQAVRP